MLNWYPKKQFHKLLYSCTTNCSILLHLELPSCNGDINQETIQGDKLKQGNYEGDLNKMKLSKRILQHNDTTSNKETNNRARARAMMIIGLNPAPQSCPWEPLQGGSSIPTLSPHEEKSAMYCNGGPGKNHFWGPRGSCSGGEDSG